MDGIDLHQAGQLAPLIGHDQAVTLPWLSIWEDEVTERRTDFVDPKLWHPPEIARPRCRVSSSKRWNIARQSRDIAFTSTNSRAVTSCCGLAFQMVTVRAPVGLKSAIIPLLKGTTSGIHRPCSTVMSHRAREKIDKAVSAARVARHPESMK
jgi:hypothetical protein